MRMSPICEIPVRGECVVRNGRLKLQKEHFELLNQKGAQFYVHCLGFLIISFLFKDAFNVHFTGLPLNKNVWAWTGKPCLLC